MQILKRLFMPLLLVTPIVFASIIIISCNKKFDEPPAYVAPNITADLTISDLKAMHATGHIEQITIEKTISGIVIADDRSGEFYKTIVIQDSTGGISVKLDGYDLYTNYPVGRMIFIKVKRLYLGDYNKLIQLGGGIDNSGTSPTLAPLASPLFDQYIIKGMLNNSVTPKVVKVADLNDSYQNTLIQLDDFEFAAADTSKTFADSSLNSSAVNFTIKSCAGENIILRNSSYADFAGYGVPNGNGTITAVYTVFGSTKQLNIRDTSDLKFYNSRCGGGGNGSLISIADIRNFYQGSDLTLGSYLISGIVISDAVNKNVSPGSIILQDDNRGIQLYFGGGAATSAFDIGDSLLVDVTGGTLKSFNGSLEISLPSSSLPASALATGKIVEPHELTVQELNANLPVIEYTLVKIKNAAASGGNTYSGNKTLADATGSITLYTSTNATFAANTLPIDTKTWTGYCNMFNNTREFLIRNESDVDDGNLPPPTNGDLIISEYIEGSSYNKYLEIYNADSIAADLSKYIIRLYINGETNASNSAKLDTLTGASSLPVGGIIVVKNSKAVLLLPSGVTAYVSGICGFNGDDVITLEKDGTVIDVFGEVGTDPGSSWTIAGSASAALDKTVRRKSNIKQGNTNWTNSSSTEWNVITTKDDVSNLGTR
jgi:Family of unknown function (DUF5689)/Lamin Tail Domain